MENTSNFSNTVLRFGAVLTVLAASLLLTSCQDAFVYHPSTAEEEELLEEASRKGMEPWPEAGEDRIGWYAPPVGSGAGAGGGAQGEGTAGTAGAGSSPPHRVIVFHGNGGQSVRRDHFVEGFQSPNTLGTWEVYILEYPGFGSRPGDPSEEVLVSAAVDGVERLLAEDSSRPVYVVGESLGTGVASQVAAAYPEAVPAILLITPFTSIVDVGAARFPGFLVRAILEDRYDNEAALSRYDGRVGFLLAGEDSVVPTELGRRLYEGYDGQKRLWIQESAGHNNLDYSPQSPWWRELTAFLLGR
ncbi:MAG: alpha/beta fold hydrolase [Spirochaetes bacterium]|jgi:pimeloyl-ACP methyl ester carboxylesterase|nr:alpha/beta fold hydrolase [Spirochaetota bacterium]